LESRVRPLSVQFLGYDFLDFFVVRIVFEMLFMNGVSDSFGVAAALSDAALGERTGESEVADEDLTVLVDQDVSWLEIPVDNIA
jgi:hypothetical protein